MSLRPTTLLVGILLAASVAWAHQDPPDCSQIGVTIVINVRRSDGVTGVVGPVTDCEQIVYQPSLRKFGAPDDTFFCAFSGGIFKFTTPDGVEHTISTDVPCVGGTAAGGCDPTLFEFVGTIPYTVSPADVHNGQITASGSYSGGVVHDGATDTTGVFVSVPKGTEVLPCGATTTVTTSSSTTSTTTSTTIPKSVCASLKVQAASQLGSDQAECEARALKFGVSVRQECLDTAIATFEKTWAMIERRGDCLTTGDQENVEAVVTSCSGALQSVLVP